MGCILAIYEANMSYGQRAMQWTWQKAWTTHEPLTFWTFDLQMYMLWAFYEMNLWYKLHEDLMERHNDKTLYKWSPFKHEKCIILFICKASFNTDTIFWWFHIHRPDCSCFMLRVVTQKYIINISTNQNDIRWLVHRTQDNICKSFSHCQNSPKLRDWRHFL